MARSSSAVKNADSMRAWAAGSALWIITLQIANGDRAAALKMLEDPDSLMANPGVMKVSTTSTHLIVVYAM